MGNKAHPTEPQPTLLFIPDISGFTKFVNTTEINHSRHIIEELLEALIDANEIGLEISEIEGDAILFYRQGPTPDLDEIMRQVERMYVNFHTHIKRYDTYRICNCGACCAAHDLTLKVVVHMGDIAKKQVKHFSKLFGPDVIIAHRLMKNDVPHDEYVLLTDALIDATGGTERLREVSWTNPQSLSGKYDFGDIDYCYVGLHDLAEQVPEPVIEDFGLPGHPQKVFEFETELAVPLEMVFSVLSDLSFRHEWQEGLLGSDDLNHKIPQNGSTHRCVINGTEADPKFISHDFEVSPEIVTFTETDRKNGVGTLYYLQSLGEERTKVQFQFLIPKNFFKAAALKLFFGGKLQRQFDESWTNLEAYCQNLIAQQQQHRSQILLGPPPDRVKVA